MNATNNYGLNGQLDSNYDNFLFFGKRNKAKRAARKKLRLEKRAAKRAAKSLEDSVVEDLSTVGVVKPKPTLITQDPPSEKEVTKKIAATPNQPQKASLMSNPLMLAGILLVVGGAVFAGVKAGKQTAPIRSGNGNS